jgi:hypothetical protein
MSPWMKIPYTLFLCLLVPVYWVHYGPRNFLWFSDLALLMIAAAMWLQSRWLASMAAVSVLLLELAWNLDFFTRLIADVRLLGLADYMFERSRPLPLRALSLFHVVMPPLLVWLVLELGYEPRAWLAQAALSWIVLPLTYALTRAQDNVNWVYGLGKEPQRWMPPWLYVGLLMVLFPLCVYLPTHLILAHLAGPRGG